MRTLSGINFNYTYMFCLVLVIRTYFDKNLIYQEIQAARILIKQKPSWQIYWTTSTPLCLIVQIADFGKKTPQTHLIIITEWPKNTPSPPILRNLDTPPWCILFHPPPPPPPPTIRHKRVLYQIQQQIYKFLLYNFFFT